MGCGEITRYLTRHGTARVRDIVSVTPALPFFLRTPYDPQGVPREFVGDRVAKLVPNSVLRVIRQAHP